MRTILQTGFSSPDFSSPDFSSPGFSSPGLSSPGLSSPGFSSPDFSSSDVSSSFNNAADRAASTAQTIIICVVIFSVIAVILKVALIYWCIQSRNRKKLTSTLRTEVQAIITPPPSNHPANNRIDVQYFGSDDPTMELFLENMAKQKQVRFTAQQLNSFTNTYSKRLGSGGFGIVYKGQLPNGLNIAVKVLNKSSDKTAEEQFMAEVGTIGKTYHINLVKLYGFCYDQWLSALVYEYMENGSLDKFLYGNGEKLEWDQLHEIAIGTAKGFAYLHEECEQRIIHYDIKPENVLLDSKFAPKVADFGLAKLINRDATHVTISGCRGTPGYLAPEFMMMNFPITHKCDVYSFGMLLFKILENGRNANDNRSDASSLDWFPKKVRDKYEKDELDFMTLDCGIEEKNIEKAKRMAVIALWCVQDSPDGRPPMSSIVKMLEGGVELMPPPKPFGFMYNSNINALNILTSTDSGFTSDGTGSSWYKDSSPMMRRHEIQLSNK